MEDNELGAAPLGLAGRVAKAFLRSKLTPLIVVASIVLGLAAVALTPREEEPQIIVPDGRRHRRLPGRHPGRGGGPAHHAAGAAPLGPHRRGVPVQHEHPNAAMFTVRFKVNEPLEAEPGKVSQELQAHPELLPSGRAAARRPPPLHRRRPLPDAHPPRPLRPAGELRKLADEVAREISSVPLTANVAVLEGRAAPCASSPTWTGCGRWAFPSARLSRPFAAPTCSCRPARSWTGTSAWWWRPAARCSPPPSSGGPSSRRADSAPSTSRTSPG